jgi:hypothetical protein
VSPVVYQRRWSTSVEEGFLAYLRTRDAGRTQDRTLQGSARLAAGQFDEPTIELNGSVSGDAEGARLVQVLHRAKPFAPRGLLRGACSAELAECCEEVDAVVAGVHCNFDSRVDDLTVGFRLTGGSTLPFDFAAPTEESLKVALSMVQDAFRSIGAVGAPPRPHPPLLVDDAWLGVEAAKLAELAGSAVLICLGEDDIFAGDEALAEGLDSGIRLICERGVISVDGFASYEERTEFAAGRLDELVRMGARVWRVLAPVDPDCPPGARASRALAEPRALLERLDGLLPPSWHASIAGTSLVPCDTDDKARETRERFGAITGLSEIYTTRVLMRIPEDA